MDIWTNPNVIIMFIMVGLIWIIMGVGIAVFTVYKIMDKYNNYGDSTCTIDEYSRKGIHYTRSLNEVSYNEKSFLFANFGANPYEGVERSVPEQLIKNAEKKA